MGKVSNDKETELLTLRDMASNGFTNSLFTVTYRIIHVTVMSHSMDDYGKKELKLQKNLNLLFFCNINGTQLQSLPSLL
jgi:hypothetical protein